jgi:hypothetical protein
MGESSPTCSPGSSSPGFFAGQKQRDAYFFGGFGTFQYGLLHLAYLTGKIRLFKKEPAPSGLKERALILG